MNKVIFLKSLKLFPFIMGLLLTLFNAVYWNSYVTKSPINNLTGTSVTTSIIMYTASTQLGFCKLHRHFIVYDSIASIWVDMKEIIAPLIGFKINFLIVSIGVILLIWLIVYLVKKKKPGL